MLKTFTLLESLVVASMGHSHAVSICASNLCRVVLISAHGVAFLKNSKTLEYLKLPRVERVEGSRVPKLYYA